MKNERQILYVQTSDSPDRQYSPLVLAQTARAMELEPIVYYLGTSLKMLVPGAADGIVMGDFPSVGEMLRQTIGMGIPVYVCEASKRMMGQEELELLEGCNVVGAGTLNDLALDSGATMWF